MIVILDNYDSFTYNLMQLVADLARGDEIRVVRNDETTVQALAALHPDLVVLSPGPGTPDSAGITVETIRTLAGGVPIFGVCLGMQSIAAAFGARIVRAPELVHGAASDVLHDGQGIFTGVRSPMPAARYHSLMVDVDSLPAELECQARTCDGIAMAIRHREHAVAGVQFHPESILTPDGRTLVANVLAGALDHRTLRCAS